MEPLPPAPDQLRRLGSDAHAAKLDERVARHASGEVTEAMNVVCEQVGEEIDSFLTAAGRRTLERVEW